MYSIIFWRLVVLVLVKILLNQIFQLYRSLKWIPVILHLLSLNYIIHYSGRRHEFVINIKENPRDICSQSDGYAVHWWSNERTFISKKKRSRSDREALDPTRVKKLFSNLMLNRIGSIIIYLYPIALVASEFGKEIT